MPSHKVIIDTDPGVDDAMAIIYAALDPDIDLVGLTAIFGNVTIDMATRNALALTEFIGIDIPVARGAEKPLDKPAEEPSLFVHGPEGFGDMPALAHKGKAVDENASEFICRMINENPGEITLCPVGPLTNIAEALRLDPGITSKVKDVVIMGGSYRRGGNVSPYAEANIWQDPQAAKEVFAADWPVTMIGLDVTHEIECTRPEFAELADYAPKLGGFLNFISQFYIRFYQGAQGFDGCCMHDAAAVIAIPNPQLFEFEEIPLDVIVDGEKEGQTVLSQDENAPKVKVAVRVKSEAVRYKFKNTIKSGH